VSTNAASLIPYFGRAWQVQIVTQAGATVTISSSQFTEALRVIFKVEYRVLLAYPIGELTIYNISPGTLGAPPDNSGPPDQNTAVGLPLNTPTGVLGPPQPQETPTSQSGQLWQYWQEVARGDQVTVCAGYQMGASGPWTPLSNIIFSGHVLQPLWSRENIVDWKLTLRCVLGLVEDSLNIVNFALPGGKNFYDVLAKTLEESGIKPAGPDAIDQETLEQLVMPRGQVFQNRPFDVIRGIAADNNLQAWIGPGGINVRSLGFDPTVKPAYAYGPPNLPGSYAPNAPDSTVIKHTLIGVPEQTQDGLIMRVLLDAQPLIGDTIQLAPETALNQFAVQIGQLPATSLAPTTGPGAGIYIVSGIRHYGDTRGKNDEWYTELTVVTANFFPDFLNPTAPQVTN
jgi:hypothetical protein